MTEVWLGLRQVLVGVSVTLAVSVGFLQLFTVLFRGLPGVRLKWEEIPGSVKWFAGIATALFVARLVGKGLGSL